ncbi:MAG TPA: polysaccharide deacetylase family protein [Symbiobacteriaceae bacterium]|nr:polysaccharide deacetylase family protein [Symbiobacteriaceae bacterium]
MRTVLNRTVTVRLLLALSLTAIFALPTLSSGSLPEADASPTPVLAQPDHAPRSGSVRILLYHHFAATEDAATITPERLDEHLSALEQAGYPFITPSQFEAFLNGEADVPSRSVLVTIDDGYASIDDVARPILIKHRVPALVFLVTGQVDQPLPGALPKLSRAQLGALAETGLFTFGGHGSNHGNPTVDGRSNLAAPYPAEPAQLFHDRVEADLVAMQALLASVGGRGAHFAFPYGDVSASLDQQLVRQGVKYAYTTDEGVVTGDTDRLRLPRFNAGAGWVTGPGLVESLAGGARSYSLGSSITP